jgi:nucleoporin SEH1
MPLPLDDVPPLTDEGASFDLIAHRSSDLLQAIAFNAYGDRCATGSVDGQIRIFNRRKDGIWQLSDSWGAHPGEILEVGCLFLSLHVRTWAVISPARRVGAISPTRNS